MKPLAALSLLLAVQAAAQVYPDTVYFNGKIVTVSQVQPAAQAFAVAGNRFVAVGSDKQVLALAGPKTKKIDLQGRTVVPGLIEAHTHPVGAAMSERDVPVPVMRTIPEVQEFIRREAARLPPDRIIFVPKVYPSRLQERRYPTRYELDAVSGNRLAMSDNGYASVLNSALLAKLNITRDTPQPDNGKIIKDARGEHHRLDPRRHAHSRPTPTEPPPNLPGHLVGHPRDEQGLQRRGHHQHLRPRPGRRGRARLPGDAQQGRVHGAHQHLLHHLAHAEVDAH